MSIEELHDPKPNLSLDLSQRQEQRLTLQQRQTLQLLQSTKAEMEAVVKKELDTNPALEEYYPERDGEAAEEGEARENENSASSMDDEEWREYYREEAGEDLSRGDSEEMTKDHDFILNSYSEPSTLYDDLIDQFALDLPDSYEPIYTYLLSSLDEKGFLSESVEEMAAALKVKKEEVSKVLALLRSYEPAGLGAKDLRESFLLQLERKGLKDSASYRIIDEHYDDMLHQRFGVIMTKLGISKEELKDALEEIGMLDFRPGRDLTYSRSANAVADIIVREKEDGTFEVETNDDSLPYVRVSKRYVEEMRKKDDSAKAFLRDRVAAAKNFITQLEFRKKTILRVAEAIVAHQEDFLRNGPGHMKPLTMLELAEELGLSESTISRTISGKYMDTPQGLMEMKDFFTRAAVSEDGVEVSNSDAKNLLKEIVDGEDKSKPLGDEEIRKLMEEKGCAIARRTVVKYREALGIPSSRLRKKL